jgi:hypothetical protein
LPPCHSITRSTRPIGQIDRLTRDDYSEVKDVPGEFVVLEAEANDLQNELDEKDGGEDVAHQIQQFLLFGAHRFGDYAHRHYIQNDAEHDEELKDWGVDDLEDKIPKSSFWLDEQVKDWLGILYELL